MQNSISSRKHTLMVVSFVAGWMILLAFARSLSAQQQDASISGTVVDSHGLAVPGALVTAKNQATDTARQVTADSAGHFVVTGIPEGRYTLEVTGKGFTSTTQRDVSASSQPAGITIALSIGSVSETVEVEDIAGNSIAGQHALSQGSLDTVDPKSEISGQFIRNFTPATTDYSEIINIAPGTISYNSNGVGLGQGTIYFRGFQDGDFNITWDGIPFNDSNNPTHHSWAFFPGLWIGSVDFDRSPGTASTIGQATYGGSINLLSPKVPSEQLILPQVSYGSFNTLLLDGQYNTGLLGPHKNISLSMDVHRLTTDGFQTFNDLQRNGGEIKVLYNPSESTSITGYSGVISLFANAPNISPYRAQINAYGWNYLMQNNDPTSAFYQAYNRNTVPTDFEYVAIHSLLKHGWFLNVSPYTYSYNNAQYYANDNPKDETGLATGPNGSSGWITEANCSTGACAIDKLNSYRKYGETSTISQTSKYGVFRAGLWYEWATSNRFQIPSDPLTGIDQAVPNFHENYWTNSYNPFVEYEWHATKKLTVIVGDKYAIYTLNFKQYADNGKVVGNLGGAPFTTSSGTFGSNLPSASASYRLTSNWSAYGQFSKGDEIPPTSVFDVTGGGQEVSKLPSPQTTSAYQGGTVLKLNRLTLDADYYTVKFQNNYISFAVTNPNNPAFDLNEYYLGPDSITKGFEAEANASLTHGFNLYANGTVGKATYTGNGVPSGLNVTDTPSYTQGLGLTYQGRGLDLGIIEKRVGDYYNDNGSYHNQVHVAPYNNVNLFLNYTLHARTRYFDQSKISFSINNLFNSQNITDVFPFNSPTPVGTSQYFATTTPSPLDQINQTAGRSFVVTIKVGLFPQHHE
jgi:iron complex outermembrane recepter protein